MTIFKLFLSVLGTFLLVARAEAGVLYASTASGGSGVLYTINQATGAVVQNIGPLNDAAGLNYGMTGLAFHPTTGILYGATHNSGSADPATRTRLVTIDPMTAEVSVIGTFNVPVTGNPARAPTMTDLAFDSAGHLYGVGSIGAQLYAINTGTGKATVVGNAGFTVTEGGGLAVSPTGVIYGTPTNDRFGTYHPILGTFSTIANPAKPAGLNYSALAFDGGTLYGINNGPGGSRRIVRIVPTNGAVIDIGFTLNAIDAIAFYSSADFNGDGFVDGDDLDVWSANFGRTTGASRSSGDANDDSVVDGADFLQWQRQLISGAASPAADPAAEPTPRTLAIASIAGLASCLRTRRRAA